MCIKCTGRDLSNTSYMYIQYETQSLSSLRRAIYVHKNMYIYNESRILLSEVNMHKLKKSRNKDTCKLFPEISTY